MSKLPLVSVIVPTYNSGEVLGACLKSIQDQSYQNVQLIVVDNNSTDDTKTIAKQYTKHVYNKGPERSAQRNFGVQKSSGEYVLIIDSDMELDPNVASQCVEQFSQKSKIAGIIIPEESFGKGFWAQCKKLERSFYIGVPWIEAARAFRKEVYLTAGGYDEDMVSGEDWDLSQRIAAIGKLGRIESYIMHNEGRLKLTRTLAKKYYYAQKFATYTSKNPQTANVSSQTSPLTRYKLFFSQPGKLLRNPFLGISMLFMKTAEFAVGAAGYLKSRTKKNA